MDLPGGPDSPGREHINRERGVEPANVLGRHHALPTGTAQRSERLPATIDGYRVLPNGCRSAGCGLLDVGGGEPSDSDAAERRRSSSPSAEARRDERPRTEQRFHADLIELIEQAASPAARP
ncbi:hypothetical protein ABZ946_10225 [Streptomyces sp. NPDC046324]|uniref:hypothetical protein n=1 Tax=Streptomyces sp. NPDC046324 TaxID=3154915 RepID=UPI0033D13EF8